MFRFFDRSILFALIVSTAPILVLCHGLLGTGPLFTCAYMVVTTAALFGLSRWENFASYPSDWFFAVFVCAGSLSFVENGNTAGWKESLLFLLSVSAYPAARLYSMGEVKPAFIWTTAIIVFAGTVVTIPALIDQWDFHHGKPYVFGEFDAAPIQFLTSLGFLVIALSCTPLTDRRVLLIGALLFLPLAIFAASMVRFTFIAMIAGLIVSAMIAKREEKKFAGMLVLVILLAVGSGLLARSSATVRLINVEFSSVNRVHAPDVAECPTVNMDNSIAIRKQLLREAVNILPEVGIFGIGLDGIMNTSCLPGMETHNSFLQALVEFGWIGGAALLLVVVSSAAFLFPIARYHLEARFAVSSVAYLAVMCLAHGRVSRDGLLFLFLGYATSLQDRVIGGTNPGDEDRYSYHRLPGPPRKPPNAF